MKSLILFVTLWAGALSVGAQGTVMFTGFSASRLAIHLYAGETGTVYVSGNTPQDIPSGTTTYNGMLIGGTSTGTGPFQYANGADYSAELLPPRAIMRRHLPLCP